MPHKLQVLGAKRKNLAGYSTASVQPHQGFVFQSDIVQQTPPAFRKKAAKVVGSKCTLLARMDAYGQDPSGAAGQQMKVGSPFKTLSGISSRVDHKCDARLVPSNCILLPAALALSTALPWEVYAASTQHKEQGEAAATGCCWQRQTPRGRT